jgi:hypothetical protein
MAGVEKAGWTAGQTRAQFAAIAWLRWQILRNGLRRKGGAGELVGVVLLSLLFLSLVLGVVVGAGFGAYFMVAKGHLTWIVGLLWGIFVLCQLLNIQLGQPTTTFDPTQLIRFPMKVETYVGMRLFFGLLTPANVAGTLTSVALGIRADCDGGVCDDKCFVLADDLCVGGPVAVDAAGARGVYSVHFCGIAGDSVGEFYVQPGV